jgi:hypothetical protein
MRLIPAAVMTLLVATFAMVQPSLIWAQTSAGIVGVARDTTGAVLPGVTVEASSPALIEKVRAAVTDGQGRFNITDLRPGTYAVTFTLPGFATFKREGIELSAGFTATANADMKVGGLEETVMVTGASPVVDIQNVRTQQVMNVEVLESLPSGQRDLGQYASLTLGATAAANDVGGDNGESSTGISIHGSRPNDGKIDYDGMNTNVFYSTAGGQQRIWKFNTIAVQEAVVDTGGAGAETETGGANVNMIPRDGANTFSLHSVLNFTNTDMASGRVSEELIARGSAPDQNSMKKVYDYGVGIGGPVVKDRLWFYSANRWWSSQAYSANNYFNKSTVWYRYEPDLTRKAYTDTTQKDFGGRFTWQAAAKHKISSSLNWQRACQCYSMLSLGAANSPEAAIQYQFGAFDGMWLSQSSWNYPATNRVLFQATASFLVQAVAFTNDKKPGPNDVSILEQTTGYRWGALPGNAANAYDVPHPGNNFSQRFAVSYVTGSHAVKTGIQTLQGVYDTFGNALPGGVNYTFRNGAPLSITMFASPFANSVRVRSQGAFLQDQWTVGRLTLNAGVRYEHFEAYVREITVPAGPFVGARTFPEVRDLPNFHDIAPRAGVSYDLFGTGKTALKASWGRYVAGQGGGDANALSPANTIFTSTDRLWNDNGNFIPDCNLSNLQANGECSAVTNLAFGQARPTTTWAESARTGWGVREYNYQYSATLQHELLTGVGITISYNRMDWKNQQAVVNNALTPADYDPYCITAPTDARLADFSGRRVCGLYDETPARFGQVDAVRVLARDVSGATARPKDVFNGVDLLANARFGKGALIVGGVTFGRSMVDYCWQNNLPNVTQVGTPASLPRSEDYCTLQPPLWDGVGSQAKLQLVYPLPLQFVVSGSFKNVPGLALRSIYQASNTEVAPSLGRNLAACRGATGAACTARAAVALIPGNTVGGGAGISELYDDRLNQIDLRLSRIFRVAGGRIQAIGELYNATNSRPAQGVITTYGPSWKLPSAILGGRLFKIGAQIDF